MVTSLDYAPFQGFYYNEAPKFFSGTQKGRIILRTGHLWMNRNICVKEHVVIYYIIMCRIMSGTSCYGSLAYSG